MTCPLRADARRNRERLVAEAKAAFLAHGTGASLEEIARQAGVGIGTLYRYFAHREALLDAVFQGEADALLDFGRELARADDALAALSTWLRAVVDRHRAWQAIAAATGPDRPNATLAASRIPVEQAGKTLLTRAQKAGRPVRTRRSPTSCASPAPSARQPTKRRTTRSWRTACCTSWWTGCGLSRARANARGSGRGL